MSRHLARALTLALRTLGNSGDFCMTCQRHGDEPGQGCNIVEKGEDERMCPVCAHPVDYQGVAIGTVVNGRYEPPGVILLPEGYRARLLQSIGQAAPGSESFG